MPTKKAVPKASDLIEKKTSAAAKRRETLSIFFLEGEGFRLEGLPEIVKDLTLKIYGEDAQGRTHLADVVSERLDDGAFIGTFPELYPDQEPETQGVCGVPVVVRSFSQDEYFGWLDLAKERGLSRLGAERRKLEQTITLASTGEMELLGAQQRLQAYTAEYDAVLKEEEADLYGLKKTADGMSLEEKLAILGPRIRELRASITQNRLDPVKLFEEIGEAAERLEQIKVLESRVSLEFVHGLVAAEGLTQEPYEAWLRRATGDDLDNAVEVVDAGNAPYRSGQGAEPLNRKERRKLMRNLMKAAQELDRLETPKN